MQSGEILSVLFGSDKSVRAGLLPSLLNHEDVSRAITVVIGENLLSTNGQAPISKIAEKSLRIAKSAECKKRATADFIFGLQTDVPAGSPESQQTRGCRENGQLG